MKNKISNMTRYYHGWEFCVTYKETFFGDIDSNFRTGPHGHRLYFWDGKNWFLFDRHFSLSPIKFIAWLQIMVYFYE